jgi:hypothetical protein
LALLFELAQPIAPLELFTTAHPPKTYITVVLI